MHAYSRKFPKQIQYQVVGKKLQELEENIAERLSSGDLLPC
jgi:hypothetical protein